MQEVSISTVDEYVKAICDIRKTFHKEYPMVNGLLEEPLFIYAPFTSIRQKMQQGRYILFPNRIGYDHDGTVIISQEIAAIPKDHNSIAMKIQINSASKAQILSDLRLFGISRESLFADSTDTVCEEITKDAYNTIND